MYKKHFGFHYSENDISHHGIIGQKWGIRRYQNPDGSLTAEGREQMKYRKRITNRRKSTEIVNAIADKLTKRERNLMGVPGNEKYIEDDKSNTHVARRFITNVKGNPASFADVYMDGEIAIATDPSYRGNKLADKNVKKIVSWYNKQGYKNIPQLRWWCENGNKASVKLAVNNGFIKTPTEWDNEYSLFVYDKLTKK